MSSLMRRFLLGLLRVYQFAISPMLGQNCRFYPSCSNYASEAIQRYGAARGSWLACKRLCKCHPWHPGGVDPVLPVDEKCQSDPNLVADSKTCCPHHSSHLS